MPKELVKWLRAIFGGRALIIVGKIKGEIRKNIGPNFFFEIYFGGMSGGKLWEFYKQLEKVSKSYRKGLFLLIWFSDVHIPRNERWNKRFLPVELWKKIWQYAEGRELNQLLWEAKTKLFQRFPPEMSERFEALCFGYLEVTENDNVIIPNLACAAASANVIKACILEKALKQGVSPAFNKLVIQPMLNDLPHDKLKVLQQYCGIVLRPLPRKGLVFGKTKMINIHTKEKFLLLREDVQHFAVIQSLTSSPRKYIFMDQYGFDVKTGAHFQILPPPPPPPPSGGGGGGTKREEPPLIPKSKAVIKKRKVFQTN